MRLRRIRFGLLLRSGVVYRLSVITIQTLFFWMLTGKFKFAISTSLAWNAINMTWYYIYHYFFARLFKIGKD